MESSEAFIVRGRCACGRKYRVRNARANMTVSCPACGRVITIADGDLRAAFFSKDTIPLQSESVEALEVIPLEYGDIRPAAQGAQLGLTHRVAFLHEVAQATSALSGQLGGAPYPAAGGPGAQPVVRRPFVQDLLASFYFAGVRNNALNILITTLACAIFYPLMILPGFLRLVGLIPLVVILIYVVQFNWLVLRETADGEDEIPWFHTDWDLWDDVAKPLIWVGIISFLCSLPAIYGLTLIPGGAPGRDAIGWLLLAGGWLFWPVAVMSIAMGGSIWFIRPDWLVRCMIGMGPRYLVAWALVMITLTGWLFFMSLDVPSTGSVGLDMLIMFFRQAVSTGVNLYFGYVTFRMIGLLFRHYRHRFPWKY